MKNFEFKSQICTTKEQSEKLLALGLKKETADMHITNMNRKGVNYTNDWQIGTIPYCDAMSFWGSKGLQLKKTAWSIIPAWSLSRLIELCEPIPVSSDWLYRTDAYFENVIACIAWRISKESFNPQFLEEKL